MEQTLFICREVDLFRIPPRTGRGHISGEWRTDDKIFTARCRVVAVGDQVEVRLEDPSNGEIFGVCPVPAGQRSAAVEAAVDSSRNFVLRIEDPATKRHAFLGMNFAERSNAFDFNVALTDFEKQLQRQADLKAAVAAGGAGTSQSSGAGGIPEAAALYRKQDLSLKQGQSITVNVKRKDGAEHAGFLSRMGGGDAAAPPLKLAPLAPPPGAPSGTGSMDAFGAASFQAAEAAPGAHPSSGQQAQAAPTQPTTVVASSEEGWATF